MKKMITMALVSMMALSLAACGGATGGSTPSSPSGTPEAGTTGAGSSTGAGTTTDAAGTIDSDSPSPQTISVTSLDASRQKITLDVPYNPKRIAVLDMAVLDMLDNWGLGDRVVGMPKSSFVDYLSSYNDNPGIANLGTLKEVDLEALMSCEPDLIFIGGRLSAQYDDLSKIAPVVFTAVDYEAGLIESVRQNAANIASIFGVEELAEKQLAGFDARIEALARAAGGKTAVVGMVTSSNLSTLGNNSRCSLIGGEVGFTNLADNVDSTHGNESSFELLVSLNPDYLFVLDRDSAINTEGAKLAREVMENELVKKTSAYQNGNVVYLTPSVWYLAEGGITATDVMLRDLEEGLKIGSGR